MRRMKAICLVALFAAGVAVDVDFESLFLAWVKAHHKTYTQEQRVHALQNFISSYKTVDALNRDEQSSITYALGPFADLSREEFITEVLMNTTMPSIPLPADGSETSPSHFTDNIPAEFDWRSYGKVTGVYNQGSCGSCWAFSATEAVESHYAIAHGPLNQLSMQQMLDCDAHSSGCNGGYPTSAFDSIVNAGGQDSLQAYPYTGVKGTCHPNSAAFAAHISGWRWATVTRNEQQMAEVLVSNGPISVCVDATTWQYYSGGVINNCGASTATNHCVVITGYSTAGQYWNVRNSWGVGWGEAGYCRVAAFKNECLIASLSCYSIDVFIADIYIISEACDVESSSIAN